MINELKDAFLEFTLLETAAVLAGILYLVFAVKEDIRCWLFSLIAVTLYFIVFFKERLWAETALQVYYLGTTAYGYYSWKYKGRGQNEEKPIVKMSLKAHLISISVIIIGSLIAGYLLETKTDAVFPYLDSFTTVGALVVTYMVTQKYIENWIYWFIVDGAGIYLFWQIELYLTSLLFVVYVIIVIFGYLNWLKKYHEQTA